MRKIATLSAVALLLLFTGTWVSAQVLETENFNYTIGDSLTSHGWLAHSGAGTNVEKDTVGLTYTGYVGSGIGGATTLAVTGQDVNKTWASYPNGVSVGTVYFSFLVTLDSAQTTGDYFIHLFKNSSTFPARVFARKAFTSNNFALGIMKGSTAANIAWSDSIYTFGTTYLVVVKYAAIAGATNDTVAMWINPNISSTEPTPTVFETAADKLVADVDTVYGIAIRQGSATLAPRGRIDGIRVVQSWRSVNNVLAVLNKTSINFSNITLGTSVTDSVFVSNTDATSINITSVTSGNSVYVVTPTSATIASGSSQKFVVKYTPTAAVSTPSAIAFISNAASSPDSVFITGNAIVPGFGISTKAFGFGNVYTNATITDSVTVTNLLAASTLTISSVASTNPLFTVGPSSGSLAVGASMKFGVSFTPTAAGVASASIVFTNNGGLGTDTLKVSGNGIVKAPGVSLTPALKDFHVVLLNHAWKDSVTLKNTGYDSLKITAITSSDPAFTITPTLAALDTQATKKFFITFTPSALGQKTANIIFTNNTTKGADTVIVGGRGIAAVPISEARKDTNNDLIADHVGLKDTLAIYAVITTPNMGASASQLSYFAQDSTGGIDIFAFGVPPINYLRGDSVLAIGTVAQFRGLDEFTLLSIDTLHLQVLKHNAALPKVKHLTLHQFAANSENYEGQLIEVDSLYKTSGTWPPLLTGNVSIYLTNLSHTDTAQMFLDIDAGIGGFPEPAYPINVVGFVSQFASSTTTYNNGYEITPRDTLDLSVTKQALYVKISDARKDLNVDGIPDHSVTKDTIRITGTITSPNLQVSNTAYFVQDSTGGVEIFQYGLGQTFVVGDSVSVVGTVAQFHGLTEFSPLVLDSLHFTLLKHKAVLPKPKLISLHEYAIHSESYEGILIQIDTLYKASGTWPVAATGAGVYVMNRSHADTVQMYINASTDIPGSAEPQYPINLICIGAQYSSGAAVTTGGYEILPRDTADIVHIVVVKVNEEFSGIPTTFMLGNNYPNPFNPSTTILYGLAQSSHVSVKIYSVLGQEIATLVNDVQTPSYYRVVWNGKDYNGNLVSSGVYFFRIIADPIDGKTQAFTQVRKMLLMK